MIPRRTYIRRSWLKRKPRRYVVPPDILAYWDWIRAQPCAVCGVRRGIEAAHVGLRGLAQKCSGWEVIPLCKKHHARGLPESHHELGKRFWIFHNLDRYGLIRKYRTLYSLGTITLTPYLHKITAPSAVFSDGPFSACSSGDSGARRPSSRRVLLAHFSSAVRASSRGRRTSCDQARVRPPRSRMARTAVLPLAPRRPAR